MSVGNAPAGGSGEYLTREEFVALGKEGAVVVARPLRFLDPEEMTSGTVNPVVCDLLIVTGSRKGEVFRSTKLIGKGCTGPLRRFPLGEDMAAHVAVGQNGATLYPQLNPASEPELAEVQKLFPTDDANPYDLAEKAAAANAPDASEPPF